MKKILFLQYTNPALYPPLEHASDILKKNAWSVLFLGTGSLGTSSLRFRSDSSGEVRLMRFCPAGWRQKVHYMGFVLWCLWWTLRRRPNWIYASDLLSCPAAVLIGAIPGIRIAYHEHDSPTLSGGSFFVRLALKARQHLAQNAEVVVLPNERRASIFAATSRNGANVRCVWNCPSRDEVSKRREPHDGRDLWALYHGSIVPARLPTAVIHALSFLPEQVKLRVIGYETIGHIGYVEELRNVARELGIADRVHFVGPVPSRADLLKWCSQCDVGLAFMPSLTDDINERAMVGASNKPFDYLSSGVALLVSDLPEWRQFFVDAGYALPCDSMDPKSIAEGLRWFLTHPLEMRAMGEQGRQRIASEWNYETQFAPIAELLKNPNLNTEHLAII